MIFNIQLGLLISLLVLYLFSRKNFFSYLTLFVVVQLTIGVENHISLDGMWLGVIMLTSVLINNQMAKSKKSISAKLKPRPYFYGLIMISLVLMGLLYAALSPEIFVIQDKKIFMSGANTSSWILMVLFSFLSLYLFKESHE